MKTEYHFYKKNHGDVITLACDTSLTDGFWVSIAGRHGAHAVEMIAYVDVETFETFARLCTNVAMKRREKMQADGPGAAVSPDGEGSPDLTPPAPPAPVENDDFADSFQSTDNPEPIL